jgi:hypothetical protein
MLVKPKKPQKTGIRKKWVIKTGVETRKLQAVNP